MSDGRPPARPQSGQFPWSARMSVADRRRIIAPAFRRKELPMPVTETESDPQAMEEAVGKIMSIYAGAMLNFMIDIGHRTGLLATAAQGPGTSEELAARAGLTERYVREWLAAMVTGGIFEYDPTTKTYSLPPAEAAVLTGGPLPLSTMAPLHTHLGKPVPEVSRAFREAGSV